MEKNVAIIIAPNWKDYAARYLGECMESIRQQDYAGGFDVFISDNETSSESYAQLRKLAPEAELILNKDNAGFARGCNEAVRLALTKKRYEYFFFVNMDTVLAPDCLSKIVAQSKKSNDSALIQARLMIHGQDDVVNSLGNDTHFLGFGYCRNYRDKWADCKDNFSEDISYVSGAAFLMPVDMISKIGLFDEIYWMYNEDQDLGWKAWLAGYKNILAPDAVVYHKYEFTKSIKQYYYMDRNRLINFFSNYRILTILLFLPALLAMEAGMFLFAIKSSWLKEKLAVWRYFFSPKTWGYLLQRRKNVKELRRRPDRDILRHFSGRIWYQEIDDKKLKLANPIFDFYFRFMRLLIFW